MTVMLFAFLIFAATYVLIITEWINKMLAALMGGFLLILTGILSQDVAFKAIDWNVIFFLIGMMLVISVMRDTGIFMWIAIKTAKLGRGIPIRIMLLMFIVTAVASAFLGSVTTIMILIPIVLLICGELEISSLPFIITMVVASNMGGAATMVGDPPNILIGSATDYTFMDFIVNLTPVIVVITIASLGLILLLYRKSLNVSMRNRAKLMAYKEENLIKHKGMLILSAVVVFLMLTGLALESTLHLGTATLSMSAGLFLVAIGGRKRVEQILINDIDWVTIFFFIGLFMIVESLVETGFIDKLAYQVMSFTENEPRSTSIAILWLSGVFSAFIDNVPFVAAMIPMIKEIGTVITHPTNIDPIWWAMSLGTCLGGNGTLIGASANIVAVGIAKHNGIHVSFKEYTKIGALFTVVSLIICTGYILLRYF